MKIRSISPKLKIISQTYVKLQKDPTGPIKINKARSIITLEAKSKSLSYILPGQQPFKAKDKG